MDRLQPIGVLKYLTCPSVTNDVFVSRNDHVAFVTADFRSFNNVAIIDAYQIEDVNNLLDLLSSMNGFLSFNSKNGLCQTTQDEASRSETAMRIFLKLLKYKRIPQGLKFF